MSNEPRTPVDGDNDARLAVIPTRWLLDARTDSPSFFLPGLTDSDMIVSFLGTALRHIHTKDVNVGLAKEPRGSDTIIYRVVYEKSTWSSSAIILVDVSVAKEAGGILISVRHSDQWGYKFLANTLFMVGVFIPPLIGSYIVAYFVAKSHESHSFPEWDRLQHTSEAIRDAVVACIEQVFRDLRIPEGMIKRSGKTH